MIFLQVTFEDSFNDSDEESMAKIPRSASQRKKSTPQKSDDATTFKKPETPKKAVEVCVSDEASTSEMTDSCSVRYVVYWSDCFQGLSPNIVLLFSFYWFSTFLF